jgi:hypothetical protein
VQPGDDVAQSDVLGDFFDVGHGGRLELDLS